MITSVTSLPYRPCVGIMLLNHDKKVWTGERLDTPGAWQMPQGGIDEGESPLHAALRELGEEISVSPEQVDLIGQTADWLRYDLPDHLLGKIWGGRYRGQQQHWFLMRLKDGLDDSVIDTSTKHPEFGRWRWTAPACLSEQIVAFKRPVYDALLTEFAPYL